MCRLSEALYRLSVNPSEHLGEGEHGIVSSVSISIATVTLVRRPAQSRLPGRGRAGTLGAGPVLPRSVQHRRRLLDVADGRAVGDRASSRAACAPEAAMSQRSAVTGGCTNSQVGGVVPGHDGQVPGTWTPIRWASPSAATAMTSLSYRIAVGGSPVQQRAGGSDAVLCGVVRHGSSLDPAARATRRTRPCASWSASTWGYH